VANIRGTASRHLWGRKVVLAVCGSIAAVKAVELARELVRHGADVVPVMSEAATRIVHPDALEFATGHRPVVRLTGQVEHVQLLGDVPERADALVVAPATANTVSKMALGVDDTPVTTCATVAFGSGVPVVVAPAMHEVMLGHPVVAAHARTLVEELGVTWVEPLREERKAKLADVEAVCEALIHRLANGADPGPLAGRRCLVITGATAEPLDPVRVVTNRSSGKSGHLLATELARLGARVDVLEGVTTEPTPSWLEARTTRFVTHDRLMGLVADLPAYDQVWMPAAIGDYAPEPAATKIASGQEGLTLRLRPLGKVIEAVRKALPDTVLVAFKAESDPARLAAQAEDRLERYRAQYVVANTAEAFGADDTEVVLHGADGSAWSFQGPKHEVLRDVARAVAEGGRAERVPT